MRLFACNKLSRETVFRRKKRALNVSSSHLCYEIFLVRSLYRMLERLYIVEEGIDDKKMPGENVNAVVFICLRR